MNRIAFALAFALPLVACTSTVETTPSGGDAGTTTSTGTAAGGAGQGGAGQGGANPGGAGQGGAGGAHTGVGGAGGSVVDVPCACPGDQLAWGTLGGYVQWNDHTQVVDCKEMTLTRDLLAGYDPSEPDRVCTTEVASCGDGNVIAVDQLAHAFGQPDVKAALAKAKETGAEPLYGRDDRPTDGQVFRMEVGALSFLVGDECHENDTPATCTPVPLGIAAARATLEQLAEALRGQGECAAALADPPK